MGFWNPKDDDEYRQLAEKRGRGERISSQDSKDLDRYMRQCGRVPKELKSIEKKEREK